MQPTKTKILTKPVCNLPSKPPDSLNQAIKRIIPNAVLSCQSLPSTPVKLWLISPNFDSYSLDSHTIWKIWQQVPYWVFCWASGLALARHILKNPQTVAGKTVVDFGTGSGVVAIASALAGARRVIACDIDTTSLLATQENARLNGVELEVLKDIHKLDAACDVLTAADVLYDLENRAFLELFLTHAKQVLLADSRVRNFSHAYYQKTGEMSASTWPDLDEAKEFNRVSFYMAHAS